MLLLVLGACLLHAPLAAQEGKASGSAPNTSRSPLSGALRSRSGAAIAGARVEVWLSPRVGLREVGIHERLTCVTDEEGRFEVAALDHYRYSAVATWRDAAGVPRQSIPLSDCTTRSLVRLVEADRRLDGAIDAVIEFEQARQAIRGTLRASFLIHDSANPVVLATRACEHGHVEHIDIPWSTNRIVSVDLHDDGGLIWRDWIALGSETKKWTRVIQVVDSLSLRLTNALGTPVSGTTVAQHLSNVGTWRDLCVSDANGFVDATILSLAPQKTVFAIRSPEHGETYLFREENGRLWQHGALQPFANGERHEVVLSKAEPIRASLSGLEKGYQRALPIILSRTLYIEAAQSKMEFFRARQVLAPDERGHFEFSIGPSRDCRLQVALTPEHVARWQPDATHAWNPTVELGWWPSDTVMRSAKLDFDVAAWRTTQLQVLSPEGEPVRDAIVASFGALAADFDGTVHDAARSDRRGRCSYLRAGDATQLLVFADAIGWATVPATEHGERVVQLTPFKKKTLHVVDRRGEPIEGVSFSPAEWLFDLGMDRTVQRVVRGLLNRGFRQRSDRLGAVTFWWVEALAPASGFISSMSGQSTRPHSFKTLIQVEDTLEHDR